MARGKRRKRKKRRRRLERAATPAPGPGTSHAPAGKAPVPAIAELGTRDEEEARVRAGLASGATREALERAKALHRREGDGGTEALVVEAYLARLDELLRAGLAKEAAALTDLVAGRYESRRAEVLRRRDYAAAWQGDVGGLVAPLAGDRPPPARAREVDDEVRRWVADPRALARCETLPATHPLRTAAAAVAVALEAVTSRPVEAGREPALPEVARRSPLAPWKLLVRALAAWHRDDDAACLSALKGVPDDSAAGRLKPVLSALTGDGPPPSGLPAAIAPLAGDSRQQRLRRALAAADRALARGRERPVLSAMRSALQECEQARPDLLEPLRRRLSVRAFVAGLPIGSVRQVIGAPRREARFWRLAARGAELTAEREHSPVPLYFACAFWHAFGRHACAEGRFTSDGPELAAVYLHQAELLCRRPPTELEEERERFIRDYPGLEGFYEGQPSEVLAAAPDPEDTHWLVPEELYARAARARPDAAVFELWLDRVQATEEHWRPADEVAQAWHQALPEDVRPLLFLADSAERRGALKKALTYLAQAEALDSLDAGVRRARRRLLVATARRHLKEARLHLLERDLADLAGLPGAGDGDRPALAAGLRWCAALLEHDDASAGDRFAEVAGLLDEELAACCLLEGVAAACGLPDGLAAEGLPPLPALVASAALPAAAARACACAQDMELPIGLPRHWSRRLLEDLASGPCGLSPRQLRTLAEAALRQRDDRLAWTTAGAGLQLEGPHTARFLLLRALALPAIAWPRWRRCLRAALELARRAGDTGLVEEALGAFRRRAQASRYLDPGRLRQGLQPMDGERIEELLQEERAPSPYPSTASYDPFSDLDEDEEAPCDCPACRRRRGEPVGGGGPPFGLWDLMDDDDEDWDDDDEDWDEEVGPPGLDREEIERTAIEYADELFPGLPQPLARELAQTLARYAGPDLALPDPEEIFANEPALMARLLDALKRSGGRAGFPFEAGRPRRRGRGKRRR